MVRSKIDILGGVPDSRRRESRAWAVSFSWVTRGTDSQRSARKKSLLWFVSEEEEEEEEGEEGKEGEDGIWMEALVVRVEVEEEGEGARAVVELDGEMGGERDFDVSGGA